MVNFGYTKADYEALTRKEIMFIYKAWEEKIVADSKITNLAFFNAYINANRKPGTKATPLWNTKGDSNVKTPEQMKKVFKEIEELEKKDSKKDWYRKILEGR